MNESETLKEYFPAGREPVRIDKESGIVFGVKILGMRSRNRRSYPQATLENAIPLYENAKVNLDHPEGDPRKSRSYQDRFGLIRNVRFEHEGLYADFHFNPKHAIAEQLLWDAENSPENVGFSHNVEAIIERENGNVLVREIVSVRSVDLVADPATTNGLFESEPNKPENAIQNPSAALESELDNARKRIAVLESAIKAAGRLIRETGNPAHELLGEFFLESLGHLPGAEQAERLIEERADFLARYGKSAPAPTGPVSREQYSAQSGVSSRESFLKAIKGS